MSYYIPVRKRGGMEMAEVIKLILMVSLGGAFIFGALAVLVNVLAMLGLTFCWFWLEDIADKLGCVFAAIAALCTIPLIVFTVIALVSGIRSM